MEQFLRLTPFMLFKLTYDNALYLMLICHVLIKFAFLVLILLAHLAKLIGEIIVCPCPDVRPSSPTMLKHLLRTRLANQSQIFCGASMGRVNESLLTASGSHDQDGRHIHIW